MAKIKNLSKKKIIIAVISVLILGSLALLVANQTSYAFVKMRAENYLCQKYDAKKSEFELVDYKHSHFYWEEYKVFLERLRWDDFSFEYKYNGRNFFVNRYKGQFYDDYQLDDLEKWCTEWLQENVDERITGLQLNTYCFLNYNYNSKTKQYIALEKDDVLNFLYYYSLGSDYYKDSKYMLIYYDIDFEQNDYSTEKMKIYNSFCKEVSEVNNVYAYQTNNKVIKNKFKPNNKIWRYSYSL